MNKKPLIKNKFNSARNLYRLEKVEMIKSLKQKN